MQLDKKVKSLIAVGASIAANCHSCLEYHKNNALERGADEEEIAEAMKVGRIVREGAANGMDKFASGLAPLAQAPAAAHQGGCGCA